MKKLTATLGKLAKLFLLETPKKSRKILAPLKLISVSKMYKVYSLTLKPPRTRKIKPVPSNQFTAKLISDFSSKTIAVNKSRVAKPFVPSTWPYNNSAEATDRVPSGEFLTKSYTNRAGTRSYKLYVPSNVPVGLQPLIVMLHGCNQNPDDFANGTGMNLIADQQKIFVAYPAQSVFSNRNCCWNWFKKINQTVGKGEASIIAGITQDLTRTYPVDSSRVYIAGLSAGGAMASTMMYLYPDLYASAGIHSGLPHAAAVNLLSALSAMRSGIYIATSDHMNTKLSSGGPIIVFHGDQDKTVHPANANQVIKQFIHSSNVKINSLSGNSTSVETDNATHGHNYSTTFYTNGQGENVAEHWKIHGAGHAWSGGKISGSYTDPLGPDASSEMVRFFLSQKLTRPV